MCGTLMCRGPFEGLHEQGIFGKVTRCEREAHERQRCDEHRSKGDGHLPAQATHVTDILRVDAEAMLVVDVLHLMDNGPSAEEQQAFEKRMGSEVEQRNGIQADADAYHHKTQLRYRGKRQYLLDVELGKREISGDECGNGARCSDDQ